MRSHKRTLLVGAALAASALLPLAIWRSSAPPAIVVPTPTLPNPNAFDDFVAAGNALVRRNEINIDSIDPPVTKPGPPPLGPGGFPMSPVRPPSLAVRESLVRDNARALALVRRGFTHTYHEPPTRSFYHAYLYYLEFRMLSILLSIEGKTKVERGQYPAAMDCYLDAVMVGQTIPRGAPLLGRRVGMASQGIGRRRAWDIVDRLDGPAAARAARRMESINERYIPYAETLQEEMWAGQASIQEIEMKTLWREVQIDDLRTRALCVGLTKQQVLRNYTRHYTRLIDQARQPYTVSQMAPPFTGDPISYRLVIASIDKSRFGDVVSVQTQNGFLTAALALRAYRAERGTYPESLAQLAPGYLKSIPVDPFGRGASLRYRRMGDGYRLYSVGPDGRDDGGQAIDKPSPGTGPRKRYRVEQDSVGDIVAGINIYG